jgi:hypothetical protein
MAHQGPPLGDAKKGGFWALFGAPGDPPWDPPSDPSLGGPGTPPDPPLGGSIPPFGGVGDPLRPPLGGLTPLFSQNRGPQIPILPLFEGYVGCFGKTRRFSQIGPEDPLGRGLRGKPG